MSKPPHETAHRAMREQQVFDRALTIVRAKYPQLAPSQHTALAVAIQKHGAFVEFVSTGTLDPGDDWIRMELDAQEYLAKGQGLFRIAPDEKTLTLALVAKLPPNASPAEQINIARRVARMTADDRLAASEGLDLTKPVQRVADSAGTPEQRARASGYTAEDKEYERRTGDDVRNLPADRRMELRREIARENAPKPTPALDRIRLDRKLDKESRAEDLMSAAREAAALGKTLEEALR